MSHFEKKKNRKFHPEGPCENVSPGPAVSVDGLSDRQT